MSYYSPAVKTGSPGGMVGSWDEEMVYRGRAPDRQSPGVIRSHSAEGRPRPVSPDIRRARHRSPSPYGRAVPPPRPSPFLYNLPPSEPIYHDIEQDRTRQAAQSLSPSSRGSDYERTKGFVYPAQRATPRLSEQVHSRAARAQPTKADDKPEMIMFSDAITDTESVLTGWSEQELIQKQQKDQKRREKHKYGKKKKKKESRILNMPRISESPDKTSSPPRSRGKYVKSHDEHPEVPDERRQGAEVKGPRFRGLMSRVQKRTVPLANEGRRERPRWKLMQSRSSEEQDSTYNDSSHGSSAVPEVDNDVAYASLPIDTARPNKTMQALDRQAEKEWRNSEEEQDASWDDEEEEPLAPGAFPVRPSDLSPRRVSSRPRDAHAGKPRAVRFGEHTEYSYSEDLLENLMPFDESNDIANHVNIDVDQESPISVMSVPNSDRKAASAELPPDFSPKNKHKIYPKSMYPKSILRNTGEKLRGGKEVYYDGVTATELDGSTSWDSPAMQKTSREMTADSVPSSAINPPFSDCYGSQLSPIRSAPSADNFSESWGEPEASSQQDDDVYSEGIDFIEAVAAVVIQTAMRRHLSKIAVEKRRAAVVTRDDMPQFENMATHMFDLAAIHIQAVFRGWWVRDCLSVDNYCAKRIQRAFRGYKCRMGYLYDVYRVIMVQSIWRRNIALKTSGQRLASVIAIQTVFRGYLLRRGHATYEDRAATRIQSAWRAYDAQMYYLSDLAAILIVQSVLRRWFVQSKILPYVKARPLGASDCLILDEYSRSRAKRETPVVVHYSRARAPSSHSVPFDESTEIEAEGEQHDKSGGDVMNLEKVKAQNKRETSKIKVSSEAVSFWKKKSKLSVASRAVDAKFRDVGKALEAGSATAKKAESTNQPTVGTPVDPITSSYAAAVREVVEELEESVEVVDVHGIVPQPSADSTKGLSVSDQSDKSVHHVDLLTQEEVRAMHEREKNDIKMSSEAANFWKSMSKKKHVTKKSAAAPSASDQTEGSPSEHVKASSNTRAKEAAEQSQTVASSSMQVDLVQSQERRAETVESPVLQIASARSQDAQSQADSQPHVVYNFESLDKSSPAEEKDGHAGRASSKMSSEAKDFWKNMSSKKSGAASEKASAGTRTQPLPVESLAVAAVACSSEDADEAFSADQVDEERTVDEIEESRQNDEDVDRDLPSTPKRVKTTNDTETQTSPQRSLEGEESLDEIQRLRGTTTPFDGILLVDTSISRQDTNATDEIVQFRRDSETPESLEQNQEDSTLERGTLVVDVGTDFRAHGNEPLFTFENVEVHVKDNAADSVVHDEQTKMNEPKEAIEDASSKAAVEATEPTPCMVADDVPVPINVACSVTETGLADDEAPTLEEERHKVDLTPPSSKENDMVGGDSPADEDKKTTSEDPPRWEPAGDGKDEETAETTAGEDTPPWPADEGKDEGTAEMTEREDTPEDKPTETSKASLQQPDSRRADMMKKLMLIKAMQESG
jgi:hypothetical protein